MNSTTVYNTLQGTIASQTFTTLALGPLMVGSLINLMLFGFSASHFQYYLTSPRYNKDTFRMKLLVFSVLGLAAVQSGLQSWLVFHYSLSQQRTADVLFAPTIVEKINTFPVGVEAALVQLYFAQRTSILFTSKVYKRIYFTVLSVLIFTGWVGAMLYLIGSFAVPANSADELLPPILNIATACWLYGCCFADIGIALAMVILLRKRINSGFMKSTDSMIKSLTNLALATSIATALFASVPALLILAFSTDALHAGLLYAFAVPLSSLYAVCLLVNLNARDSIRAKGIVTENTPTFVPTGILPKLPSNTTLRHLDLQTGSIRANRFNNNEYQMEHLSEMKKGFEGRSL